MRNSIFYLSCIAFIGCASGRNYPIVVAPETFEVPSTDTRAKSEAIAEYIFHHGELRFLDESDPSAGWAFTRHAQLQVYAPAGRGYAEVSIGTDHFTHIESLWGRVVQPDGTILNLSKYALEELNASGPGILYHDAKRNLFVLPGVQVGSIIEYHYTVHSRQSHSLPSWVFNSSIPVKESRFEVKKPEGWQLTFKISEEGESQTTSGKQEGDRLVFEKRNLPALKGESFSLPRGHRFSVLNFTVASAQESSQGVFGTWNDVGRWYLQLTQSLGEVEPSVVDAARSWMAQHPQLSQEAALFYFVRDRIRYVAIFEGLGAFRPHAPSEVYRVRFGDCKDMSTLLLSLYRAFGIEAAPVLIGTKSIPNADRDLPSIGAFNHVIVGVKGGEGWIYSDPTHKEAEYGQLSDHTRGRGALIVSAQGTEFVRTPELNPALDQLHLKWEISAEQASKYSISASGTPAERLSRMRYYRGQILKRLVENSFIGHLSQAKAEKLALKSEKNRYQLTFDFEAKGLFQGQGQRKYFDSNSYFRDPRYLYLRQDRKVPIIFEGSRLLKETVQVNIPPGWKYVEGPVTQSHQGPGAKLSFRVSQEGSKVLLEREIRFEQHRYSPQQAKALKDFGKKVMKTTQGLLVFEVTK